MNLLNKKWLNLQKLNVEYKENKMLIKNEDKKHKFLIYPKLFKATGEKIINLKINGNLIKGTGCVLKILNRKKEIIASCGLNSNFIKKYDFLKYYIVVIYVPGESKIEIDNISLSNKGEFEYKEFFKSDTLLVTPGYPSLENKYNTAFVHTRVKAYKEKGIDLDVAIINSEPGIKEYRFEGIKVFKGEYKDLREILKQKRYKKILIHFFNHNYANILDSVDTTESKIYVYLHGAETLYRDWPKICSNYFMPPTEIDSNLEQFFKVKDFYIKKYNEMDNVKWFFVTEWTKKRCEELLNIKFKNSEVLPCLIDTNLFAYEKKNINLRKKIFVLRKFDNISSYAIDIDVRIILELSHRNIFKDLEFDIYGDGNYFDTLVEPLKEFKNVHLHKGFLTHEEIRKVHQTHGIGLFATRFDSQAVSSCEAASSGCAVVSSKNPGVMQFFDEKWGILCDTENFVEYADTIERLYNNPDEFLKVAKLQSDSVQEKFGYKNTIEKELNIFEKEKDVQKLSIKKTEEPILSVIIPSYNVEKYLYEGVITLINHNLAHKMEILIINDGSKDNTAKIADNIIQKPGLNKIVKIVNKDNGGHGSTINVGIKMAKGKYIKIMDGDDTVDSKEMEKLIQYLENEEVDIVLNNYIEDFASLNYFNIKNIYDNLIPGLKYNFDDLCYKNYGFKQWGPILACSTYKADLLKNNGIKLLEKCFYVDMQLNTFISLFCKDIKYYPLNIYRYLLGQQNQSVSRKSYAKNYKDHERVTLEIIKISENYAHKISNIRKKYIEERIIIPMITTQYYICTNYKKNGKAFREFDKKLKKYGNYYNHVEVVTRGIKFHRVTKGCLIIFNPILIKINNILKRIVRNI